MCIAKYFNCGVSAGLLVEINNPVSTSHVWFQQLRVTEHF